ncbi:MAG: TetR/AcrR family transcriptional regulator [Acidimicrobiales bacterium]
MSSAADASSPPRRRLTPRGKERRDRLLAYATEQFAANGFHPTSVADIVDGVGVGKGVFYWYFPSKDELLLEILREALYDLRRTQQSAIVETDDPLQRLENGIRSSLAWIFEHADIVRLISFAWTEETFAVALRRGREVTIADTARHLTAAMSQGLIPDADVHMLATAIRGVTDELGRQYLIDADQLDDEVVDTAVRMCLYGVAGVAAH